MRASTLDPMMAALDPLNTPVTMTLRATMLDTMVQSPPSSGPVKESQPVPMLHLAMY